MIVGVDGCPDGWLCVADFGGTCPPQASIHSSFEGLLKAFSSARCIAIDIPIGLPNAGARGCDVEARRLLKPRGSSVFPTPVRGVVGSTSYEDAVARHRAIDGRALSQQAYAILPKITEVDTAVRSNPVIAQLVFEVHPELSFRT